MFDVRLGLRMFNVESWMFDVRLGSKLLDVRRWTFNVRLLPFGPKPSFQTGVWSFNLLK